MESSAEKVENELKWIMDVQEMPHKSSASYPIFRWSFGEEGGITGAKLHAWPFHGLFVFKVRGNEIKFSSIQDLLKEIDSYGWGKPPHIEEVFKDITETKERSPLKGLEEFKQVAERLRQKWNKLVV